MYIKCGSDIGSEFALPGQENDRPAEAGGHPGKANRARERQEAAALKYGEAVRLYASTGMTVRAIARQCNVTASGLQAYISRHHRGLMLARYHIPAEGEDLHAIKIQPRKGPTPAACLKYKDAVEACGSPDYIELNVSQVARQFGVSETGLANFMKVHYSDVLAWRGKVRCRLGIDGHAPRGSACTEQYAEAVELYRTTEYTIPEVVELCRVSPSGLSQHLRFYHHDVIDRRGKLRSRPGKRERGERVMNGRRHEPDPETERKYAEALALYRDTPMMLKDIVEKTGVPMGGFRSYLRIWHRGLVMERSGVEATDGKTDLRSAKKRMKAVAAKYAGAIAELKSSGRPVESVAKEYGHNPETFRNYLHRHEPELASRLGMTRDRNGRLTAKRSEGKYGEAVRLYEATGESLKSIAARLGLVYNSLGGYVRRHYPELIRRHNGPGRKEMH